jgi:hypothetical protein
MRSARCRSLAEAHAVAHAFLDVLPRGRVHGLVQVTLLLEQGGVLCGKQAHQLGEVVSLAVGVVQLLPQLILLLVDVGDLVDQHLAVRAQVFLWARRHTAALVVTRGLGHLMSPTHTHQNRNIVPRGKMEPTVHRQLLRCPRSGTSS